jgi:hypothetical protein
LDRDEGGPSRWDAQRVIEERVLTAVGIAPGPVKVTSWKLMVSLELPYRLAIA